MIVAPSRKAAVRYKEILTDMGVEDCKIIMSESPIDKEFGWDKYWFDCRVTVRRENGVVQAVGRGPFLGIDRAHMNCQHVPL